VIETQMELGHAGTIDCLHGRPESVRRRIAGSHHGQEGGQKRPGRAGPDRDERGAITGQGDAPERW
jgi:hypothetical protein